MTATHNTFTLHTARGEFELAGEDILVNEDPILPGERHAHNMRLFVIGHEYGPIVALLATNEQDAFDEMLDKGYEHFLLDPVDYAAMSEDEQENYTCLGNASEPCDLTYAWIEPVTLEFPRDRELIYKFAEARGASADNLDF